RRPRRRTPEISDRVRLRPPNRPLPVAVHHRRNPRPMVSHRPYSLGYALPRDTLSDSYRHRRISRQDSVRKNGGNEMGKLGLVLVSVLFGLLLAAPQSAFAGPFILHPSGFGEHSYSSWKGSEGLPDNTGNKDQALYFQKMTDTTTFAAGVAIFKGFEGMS